MGTVSVDVLVLIADIWCMQYKADLHCVHVCVFSAPEVLTVYPYDHAADWWSVGILMYTMLLGKVERLLLG